MEFGHGSRELSALVEFLPVPERLLVALVVQLGHARLQAFLHLLHGKVVDRGADLFKKETQQRASLMLPMRSSNCSVK